MVKRTLARTTKTPIIVIITTQTTTEMTKNRELSSHLMRHVAKPITPQRNVTLEPMQQICHLLKMEDRWERIRTNDKKRETKRMKLYRFYISTIVLEPFAHCVFSM